MDGRSQEIRRHQQILDSLMNFSYQDSHIDQLPTVLFLLPALVRTQSWLLIAVALCVSSFDFPSVLSVTLLPESSATDPDHEKQQEKQRREKKDYAKSRF